MKTAVIINKEITELARDVFEDHLMQVFDHPAEYYCADKIEERVMVNQAMIKTPRSTAQVIASRLARKEYTKRDLLILAGETAPRRYYISERKGTKGCLCCNHRKVG